MRKLNTTNDLGAVLKNGVVRYRNRDIVMVLVNGNRQPFYKSTGRSSGMPNTWLPFDGVKYPNTVGEWFDKEAYVVNGKLHRFGSELNMEISNALASIDIPEGMPVKSGQDVNLFLGVSKKYATCP
jgi:hypothetical protein